MRADPSAAEQRALHNVVGPSTSRGFDVVHEEARERLRLRFGLTKAETDVALEILKGDGRTAAAARLGIAPTTVRAHLSHIFEKTGVHRQAELVRLLMQGGHGMARPAE